MRNELPPDYIDRPRLQRLWIDFLVLIQKKEVKMVCCESFRLAKPGKELRACKGCATLYNKESASPWYRFLGRIAKRRPEPVATPAKPDAGSVS